MPALSWLSSDVTGWGAFGALAVFLVVSLARGWVVLRPSHRALIAAEVRAALAESAAEIVKTGFYREAYGIERERNNVVIGGMMTMMTEIRTAVIPGRTP